MRPTAILMGTFISFFAMNLYAQQGLPSPATLAEMGLFHMEILSDHEAAQIRVRGFPPNRWGNLYPFVHGVSRLEREQSIIRPAYLLRLPSAASQ